MRCRDAAARPLRRPPATTTAPVGADPLDPVVSLVGDQDAAAAVGREALGIVKLSRQTAPLLGTESAQKLDSGTRHHSTR